MSSTLFSPIRIGDLELANRIVVSPMCQYSAVDGCATDWHLAHLGMLVNSGAALVVLESTGVTRSGRITHGCLGLYSDANEDALARVIAHCRRAGTAKLGIQLGHAGRKGSSHAPWDGGLGLKDGEDHWETIAPSALAFGPAWPPAREATDADMAHIRDGFVRAAQRAVRLGFDAIELHGAHGYLLHSFLSPISNKRTDAYGDSLENRLRFPLDVVKAVRAVVPAGLPLGSRITGDDWEEGGIKIDEAVAMVKALKAAGLDYVDVSSGGLKSDTRNPTTPGYNAPLAAQVKRDTGIATRTVGLISTAEQAEAIIAEGKADMVALGRAMLDHPHWGWQAARTLGAEVARPRQYLRAAPKMWPGAAAR